MRFLLITLVFVLSLHAEKILLINSNGSINKYNDVVKSFRENFKHEFMTIDISKMSQNEIKEYLYDEYPDIVYAVGSKGYQYAHKYLPEKKIFFSSIVNWKRLPYQDERYGISNELHAGMQLTLIKSFFKKIKKISVIYSKYTSDIVQSFKENSKLMGIEIIAQEIQNAEDADFDSLLKNGDAFIVIPDPVLLNNKENIDKLFSTSQKYQKPVFAYDDLYLKYGAVLISSVDNPTIGRQMAAILQRHLNKEAIEKVHSAMGTNIVFNKNEATKLGIDVCENIASLVTRIIE